MHNLTLFLNNNCDLFNLIISKNIFTDIKILKNTNTYTFLFCEKEKSISKIADIITEFIIENYEFTIVKKLISSDYSYFSACEKELILNKTLDLLASGNNDIIKILIILKRRFLIKQSILKFISDNSYLHLSGFINFRLFEYKSLLSELIEKNINEIKVQNEYKEFIAMLKFFVDTQKNRVNKLHVVFEKDGEYAILNEHNKNITVDCFTDFLQDNQSHTLSNEDLLISALISLAPKKIIIHLTGENYNKKILSTIEQIFANKVILDESIPMLQLVNKN